MRTITATHTLPTRPLHSATGTASLLCRDGVFATNIFFEPDARPLCSARGRIQSEPVKGVPDFDRKDITGTLSYPTDSERVLELNTTGWKLEASEGQLTISFYFSKVAPNNDDHYECHAQSAAEGYWATPIPACGMGTADDCHFTLDQDEDEE